MCIFRDAVRGGRGVWGFCGVGRVRFLHFAWRAVAYTWSLWSALALGGMSLRAGCVQSVRPDRAAAADGVVCGGVWCAGLYRLCEIGVRRCAGFCYYYYCGVDEEFLDVKPA